MTPERARKIQALRNLAERPGTSAEGEAARAALKRLESKEETDESAWYWFERFLHTHDIDDLDRAVCESGSSFPSERGFCADRKARIIR